MVEILFFLLPPASCTKGIELERLRLAEIESIGFASRFSGERKALQRYSEMPKGEEGATGSGKRAKRIFSSAS